MPQLFSCRWGSKNAFSLLLAVEGRLVGKVCSSVQIEEQLVLMVTANCCVERNIRANLYPCEILCRSHTKCPDYLFLVVLIFCFVNSHRACHGFLTLCCVQDKSRDKEVDTGKKDTDSIPLRGRK